MNMAHEDIVRYYTEWWENPKDPRNVVFEALNDVVRCLLPDGRGKRALDIGSGRGRIVSYLLEKGYDVVAVELNEEFVRALRERFPAVHVIHSDFETAPLEGKFDLVTAIEVIQNIERDRLHGFFEKIAGVTDRVFLNISNTRSLHGAWLTARGFRMDFVYHYSSHQICDVLRDAGFQVAQARGIGFLTPITLYSGFRGKIIPEGIARFMNRHLDPLLPRWCHLYFVEAVKDLSLKG